MAVTCGSVFALRSVNHCRACAVEPLPVTCMSGDPSRPWGIAEIRLASANNVSNARPSWLRLNSDSFFDCASRPRQSKANSHTTTTISALHENVENPSPNNSQSRNFRRVRPLRESPNATRIITISSPQYSTAGPTAGPQVASSQRFAGRFSARFTFAAGMPSATDCVCVNMPSAASVRKRISNRCVPGVSGRVNFPSCARKFNGALSRVTPSTCALAGKAMTWSPPWLARKVSCSVWVAACWPASLPRLAASIARCAPSSAAGRVTVNVRVSPGSG